jgi:hypothetical protein
MAMAAFFKSLRISLIEFRIKGVQFLRALHIRWQDKTGQKETVIPVPSRRSEFGPDCPEDIDNCEQVRRWDGRRKPWQ